MQNYDELTRATPNQYLSKAHALEALDFFLKDFKNPLIISGEKSLLAFKKHYKKDLRALKYDKSASEEDMQRLASLAKSADVVLGIGGGKALDTSKGVAELLNAELIAIPTILGTCAATTPIAAVYEPNHAFKKVGYYKRTPFACVVDLNLLISSPKRYFLGGIGDTLAKFYEASSIIKHAPRPLSANVELGFAAAKLTKEILLQDSFKALQDFGQGVISAEFSRIVDTIFNISAAVGCFACKMGRASGAHAIHNALSLFKSTHEFEHGVKVAYGLLVQLAVLEDFKELERLKEFYKQNGFTIRLKDFGVEFSKENLRQIADYAASSKESFVFAKPDISAAEIIKALEFVENLT